MGEVRAAHRRPGAGAHPEEHAAQAKAAAAAQALREAMAAYALAGYGSHVTDPLREAMRLCEWSLREIRQ